MIEKKHCYRCNRFKPVDGGKMVRRADGQMKWSCGACIELRKPPRKFTSKTSISKITHTKILVDNTAKVA